MAREENKVGLLSEGEVVDLIKNGISELLEDGVYGHDEFGHCYVHVYIVRQAISVNDWKYWSQVKALLYSQFVYPGSRWQDLDLDHKQHSSPETVENVKITLRRA